jgi:hypothetical protein
MTRFISNVVNPTGRHDPHGCLKEGDTPSWFFFLPQGGNQPDDPTDPGWGGQFAREPDGCHASQLASDC